MSADTPPIKLYTALLAAMREFGAVKKDRQNPAFRSSYATLNSILEAVEGPLNDHGLILVQRFSHDANYAVLLTELIHAESGECITSAVPIACAEPNNPQKVGGAITYYRRYSLLTLLNLTPEEDDDGNSASQPPRRDQQPANRPAPPARTTPPAAQPVAVEPLSAVAFKNLIERVWTQMEDGATLAAIKDTLEAYRPGMNPAQKKEVRDQLVALETSIAERDALPAAAALAPPAPRPAS